MGTEDGADFWPGRGRSFLIPAPPRLGVLPKSRQIFPALALQHPNLCQMTLFFWQVYKSVWISLAVSTPPSEFIKHPGMKIGESQQQQDEGSLLKSFPCAWLCLGSQFQPWNLPAPAAASITKTNWESKLLRGRRCFPGETSLGISRSSPCCGRNEPGMQQGGWGSRHQLKEYQIFTLEFQIYIR